MFYLAIFFLLLVFACFDFSQNDVLKQRLFLAATLLLLLVSGLRYETGFDWIIYSAKFSDTPALGELTAGLLASSLDLGYFLLVSSVKSLGGTLQIVFFIMACLSFFFLYQSLLLYTPYRNTSLLIYFCIIFFILDMSGMRQAVALNISFYAFQYILTRNLLRYLVFILLACSFHWSAIIFIPAYWLLGRRIPTAAALLFCALCVAAALGDVGWIRFALEQLNRIPHEGLQTQVTHYLTNPLFSQPRVLGWSLVPLFCMLAFLSAFRKKFEQLFPYFTIFYNLFLFQFFTVFMLHEHSDISLRFGFYAQVSTVVLLPYFFSILDRSRGIVLGYSCCVIFYSFWLMKSYLLTEEMAVAYNPYQNYIVYKAFNLESDGKERIKRHSDLFQARGNREAAERQYKERNDL